VPLATANAVVEVWLDIPVTRVLLPSEYYSQKVFSLMERAGVSGQLTSDASRAVFAVESRAMLCSNDTDFARFPGLRWTNPLLDA
jgi:predicted nucleic acid-binding protein